MARKAALELYRLAVIAICIPVLIVTAWYCRPGVLDWRDLLVFLLLTAVINSSPHRIGRVTVGMGFVAVVPLVLMYGGGVSALVYALGNVVAGLFSPWGIAGRPRSQRITISLFNACSLGMSTLAGTIGYGFVAGKSILSNGPGLDIQPAAIITFVLFHLVINHLLIDLGAELQLDGRIILHRMLRNATPMLKVDLLVRSVTLPLGLAMAKLYAAQGLLGVGALTLPLLFANHILRLYFDLLRANGELTILHDVSKRIGTVLQPERLFELIAQTSGRVVRYSECALYLSDEVGGALRLVMTTRPDGDTQAGSKLSGDRLASLVAESREPVLIHDAARDLRFADTDGARSLLAVPLLAEGKLIGVLVLSAGTPGAFLPDHLRMLMVVGSQAAVALQNAILYRRTEEHAVTDPLTGLNNYRYLFVCLRSGLREACMTGRPLSAIYLDLDRFKQCNDTYGHLVGDRVLQEFADILRRHVRAGDTVVRYAGDEFVVLLPGADANKALAVAERIRHSVQSHVFGADEGLSVNMTVSAGIAWFPGNALQESELLRAADAAMYEGKRQGANRVTIARSVPAESTP